MHLRRKRPETATIAIIAFLLSFAVSTARAETKESSCALCHEKKAEAEAGSVHQRDTGCTGCHGGDPAADAKEAAHAVSAGYKGETPRRENPLLCGGCHSDVETINPYGLPTDQLAQYKVSKHGKALFKEGITDVATCTDCHGAHGILRASDPQSSVFPKNVPSTCGRCHADDEKMDRHGLPSDQVEKYSQSIHAQTLFEKGDLSSPTCATCHGNHGAAPPGFVKVGQVCGKCHIKQEEFFLQSPHAAAADKEEFEACITCHNNHKVTAASEKLFRVCTLCHAKGEDAFNTARDIYRLIKDSKQAYGAAEGEMGRASREGFLVEDEQILMEDAKTYLTQLPPMQHSLNLEELKQTAAQVGRITGQVEKSIQAKREAKRHRKLALVPLAVFFVFMSLMFWLKKRRIETETNR